VAKVKISAAPSIRRLPSYLHIIRRLQGEKNAFVSGTVIAQELNLEPIQVRKDLAITGIIGKPKKGYPVQALIDAIEHFLGWDSPHDAVLVGVGNLGIALLGYGEFRRHGLRIVAAFDKNPQKTGSGVHGAPVFDTVDMEERIRNMGVTTAILTVPSVHAQEIAGILVSAGIRGIWNFTNVKLKVPEGVVVQKEDLSSGYAMLCVMLHAKKPEEDGGHGAGRD
jgi:redox-sensing transcriptional repressor